MTDEPQFIWVFKRFYNFRFCNLWKKSTERTHMWAHLTQSLIIFSDPLPTPYIWAQNTLASPFNFKAIIRLLFPFPRLLCHRLPIMPPPSSSSSQRCCWDGFHLCAAITGDQTVTKSWVISLGGVSTGWARCLMRRFLVRSSAGEQQFARACCQRYAGICWSQFPSCPSHGPEAPPMIVGLLTSLMTSSTAAEAPLEFLRILLRCYLAFFIMFQSLKKSSVIKHKLFS